MVLVHKHAAGSLTKMLNVIDLVDDVQAQLTLPNSGFSQDELYDQIEAIAIAADQ